MNRDGLYIYRYWDHTTDPIKKGYAGAIDNPRQFTRVTEIVPTPRKAMEIMERKYRIFGWRRVNIWKWAAN